MKIEIELTPAVDTSEDVDGGAAADQAERDGDAALVLALELALRGLDPREVSATIRLTGGNHVAIPAELAGRWPAM